MRIGGNSSSRRRTKINFNSYYNSSLRNNRFLERHPENRRVSAVALNPNVFSGVGEAAGPQTTLASPLSMPQQVPIPTDLQKYYVIEETTTIELAAQSYEEILNEAEDGEILAIEAVTSSPLITIEVVIYGMGNSANVINDHSINKMIELGRGLTPGDVETLPGGRSKDTTGMPRRYYPYIARYKDDDLVDYLGQARRNFVFVYEPAIPMPYSSIIINVKNTSTEAGKTVDSVNIHRRVYDNPYLDNLAGRPIESSVLFKAPTATVEQKPTVPIPPGTSPYVANYLQRQKELAESAAQPEIVPSEDFY